jgi:voltage-gated potassium channel
MSDTATPEKSFFRSMFTNYADPKFLRWQGFLNFLIFISCITMTLETVEPFATEQAWFITGVECVAVAFFTIDYLANLFFAKDRIKYFFSFWGMVDLLSILPSYLMLLNFTALRGAKVFRLLRVVRVLRVLKIARMALQQMSIPGNKGNPIVANLRIYLIALFSVMMISSTLMYHIEGGLYSKDVMEAGQAQLDAKLAQDPASKDLPEEDRKFVPNDPVGGQPIPTDKHFFTSIPTAMWWCIVTLTTTGYGDMYPVSFGGRVVAGTTMLLGLVLFGILMNIVGKTLMVLLFGEQTDDSHSAPSQEAMVKSMLAMGLITGAQYDELLALPAEEFKRKIRHGL